MAGLLLALDAVLYPLDANLARVGGFGPVNMTKLTITQPDPEQIQRISYMRSTRGQALDSYSQPKPMEIEFTIDDCDPDLLAMAIRGTPASYSQPAATGVSVEIVAHHGLWVAIGRNNLTAFSITGKTEGVDYEVDMEAGLFRALAGGSIANGASVTATLSCAARSGMTVVSGTVPTLNMAITGHGINLFSNKQIDIDIFQASISPSGAIDFISNEPITLTFKGTLVKPANKAGPYAYTEHA